MDAIACMCTQLSVAGDFIKLMRIISGEMQYRLFSIGAFSLKHSCLQGFLWTVVSGAKTLMETLGSVHAVQAKNATELISPSL